MALMAAATALFTPQWAHAQILNPVPDSFAAGTLVERADYMYPDPVGPNGEPNPAVWSRQEVGQVPIQGVPGLGLGIADPGSGSQLLYQHPTAFLTGDPSNVNFTNQAILWATATTSAVADNSSSFDGDATTWRLILDDGSHRVELALARHPVSRARLVRLQDAAAAPAIPFPWDNDFPNRYEIARTSSGDAIVTLTNGDSSAPNRVVTQLYPANLTAPTNGIGRFAWGAGLVGGGASFWQEVHGGVFAVSPIPEPSTYAMLLAGLGLIGWVGRRRNRRAAQHT